MRSIEAHTRDHSLLDSASMGRREYWLWLLASGGTLIDGLSVFSLGIAMPLVTSRFALNPLMVGLIGSALVLGAVFGAVRTIGRLLRPQARLLDRRGDHCGRRIRQVHRNGCCSANCWWELESASTFPSALRTRPR